MSIKLSFTEDQIQAMFLDYQNRIDYQTILKNHSVSDNTFKYLRKKYHIPARPPVVEEDVAAAVNEFINGAPMMKTAEKYGISHATMSRYMKQHNIVYKNGHGRKHHFNEEYFADIDNEHKAYWLGFLYADGSVGTTDKSCTAPNRLAINISSKDKNLLYDFLSDVEAYDTKIMDYMPSEKTYGNTMMSRVYLNSKTLCSHLIEHGCVPNKTFDISMPDLPPKMISHFIRGLFDGDGNITSGPTFRITGYHIFMAQIHTLLNISCNLNSRTSLKYYPEKDPRICDLCFGGPNLCTKIFHYLYDNATICLQRKFEKFKTLTK